MLGIGVDICEVNRFDKLKENENFLKKIFTENEIQYCDRKKNDSQCYAARFSAKEAFVKALGIGFGKGVHYKEIEVLKNSLGKPYFNIIGETKETLNNKLGTKVHLSMSHEKSSAIAFVVIEKE